MAQEMLAITVVLLVIMVSSCWLLKKKKKRYYQVYPKAEPLTVEQYQLAPWLDFFFFLA